MRIIITGGAGCLGGNLVERYLPEGHEILVFDNFATGKREVVPSLPGLTLVEGSVADAALVDSTFAKFQPTHVIHSAAAYKDPQNHVEDTTSNVLGSIHVARAAKSVGARRVVNFQTALCYGRPRQVPVPIDHPTQPFTSYGISKTAGEQFLQLAGLPLVSLRLANICGPRLAIGPIPTFYKRLKAGQSCFCSDSTRDFLDMQDFFALMDRVLADRAPTGVFNVSTGEGRSIHDIYVAVAKHLGIDPPPVKIVPVGADDVPAVVLDPSHTERTFGWRAQSDFDATIRRQLEWYDAHGVTDIFSHLTSAKGTA
jgi:UDP-glucose 4-epimerase